MEATGNFAYRPQVWSGMSEWNFFIPLRDHSALLSCNFQPAQGAQIRDWSFESDGGLDMYACGMCVLAQGHISLP